MNDCPSKLFTPVALSTKILASKYFSNLIVLSSSIAIKDNTRMITMINNIGIQNLSEKPRILLKPKTLITQKIGII